MGKLGSFWFEPGYYLYIGSAFGPGGVHARLKHHCRLSTKLHWHIDYLRQHAEVVNTWYVADQRYEHRWAQQLDAIEELSVPVAAFGSSDCTCESHLFFSDKVLSQQELLGCLSKSLISLSCKELTG